MVNASGTDQTPRRSNEEQIRQGGYRARSGPPAFAAFQTPPPLCLVRCTEARKIPAMLMASVIRPS